MAKKTRKALKARARRAAPEHAGFKCPFCRASDSVWRGFRYNEKSKKRMRLCKKCGRKFTPDDGFLRMRFEPEDIRRAVTLYKKGFSLAEVQQNFRRQGIKVSRWTVSKWNKRFGK
jgi:transposase-like protein